MVHPLHAFHYADSPIHAHTDACDKCEKRRSRDSAPLSRCGKCNRAKYCSKECQMEHWNDHKLFCKDWRDVRERAVNASGKPSAGLDWAIWCEYHFDSIANALLAHSILETVYGRQDVLIIQVAYDGNAQLAEHKFVVDAADFLSMDSAERSVQAALQGVASVRANAWRREQARRSSAQLAPHMATCVFLVSFAEEARCVRDYCHFTFTQEQLRSELNEYIAPEYILMRMFEKGKRARICCADISKSSACCCGGWTHEGEEEELFPLDSLRDEERMMLERGGYIKPTATPIGANSVKPKKKKPKKKKHSEHSPIDSESRTVDSLSACGDSTVHVHNTSCEVPATAFATTKDDGRVSEIDTTSVTTSAVAETHISTDENIDENDSATSVDPGGAATGDLAPDTQDLTDEVHVDISEESSPPEHPCDDNGFHSVLAGTHSVDTTEFTEHNIDEDQAKDWVPVVSKKAKRQERQRSHLSARSTRDDGFTVKPKAMMQTGAANKFNPTPKPVFERPSNTLAGPHGENPKSTVPISKPEFPSSPSPAPNLISSPQRVSKSPTYESRAASLEHLHRAPSVVSSPTPNIPTTLGGPSKKYDPHRGDADALKAPHGLEHRPLAFGSLYFDNESSPSSSASATVIEPTTPVSVSAIPTTDPKHDIPQKTCSSRKQRRRPTYAARRQERPSDEPSLSHLHHMQSTNPPPGLDRPYAPRLDPYLNPYATQANLVHYPYIATHQAHIGAYGATSNLFPVDPLCNPFTQPIYTQQGAVPVPISADAAQAIQDATRQLVEATRALQGATQEYYRAGGVHHMKDALHDTLHATGAGEDIHEETQEAFVNEEDSSTVDVAQARGRRRRVSMADITEGNDLAEGDTTQTVRHRAHSVAVESFNRNSWQS